MVPLLIIFTIAMLMTNCANVNGQASAFTQAEIDQALLTHNNIRGSVNPPAANMPSLVWDSSLATIAYNWAQQCNGYGGTATTLPSGLNINPNRNAQNGGVPVGENVVSYSGAVPSPRDAILFWASQNSSYTYSTNTCAAGKNCNSYKQIIWAATTKVGCARSTCNFTYPNSVVCDYVSAGNSPSTALPYTAAAGVTSSASITRASSSATPPAPSSTRTAVTLSPSRSRAAPTPTASATYSSSAAVFTAAERDEMLQWHNTYRSTVVPAAATPIPALLWNDSLAIVARNWAARCIGSNRLDHNPNRTQDAANQVPPLTGYVGENIYMSTAGFVGSAYSAVTLWNNENVSYTYSTNTCNLNEVCGHYTQVVWAQSRYIGCARSSCPNFVYANSIVCNYYPGGNYNGQKPY